MRPSPYARAQPDPSTGRWLRPYGAMTELVPVPAAGDGRALTTEGHGEEHAMSDKATLPPRWVVRLAWVVHRAIYRVTGGRRGLAQATPTK